MARRKTIDTYRDAILFAGYLGRFTEGEFGRQMRGLSAVLWTLNDELEKTKQRCAALAAALEKAEMKSCDGKDKP